MKIALLASVLPLVATGTLHAAPNYMFTDLNMKGGTGSIANSINESGQVSVRQFAAVSRGDHNEIISNAAVWDDGITTLAQEFEGNFSIHPIAFNNLGDTIISDGLQYSLWSGGQITTINGATHVYDINNSGQILGSANYSELWSGPNLAPVDISNNHTFFGTALNNNGLIAGSSVVSGHERAAIRTTDGQVTEIGTLGGRTSEVSDMSDNGTIIGESQITNGDTRSYIYHDGEMSQLGYIPGGIGRIDVNAVNDHLQSVGSLSFGTTPQNGELHAVLWNNTHAVDLNNYLDADIKSAGWLLTEATDINNHGNIVGEAHNYITNENHAFLFSGNAVSPIPEPSTYAMLLAGLSMVGFMVRRRKLENG